MKRPDGELDLPTNLAFERTRIAQERTLLAWVRTAIALISFGFTIYSVFALESGILHKYTAGTFGPELFAVVLILIGLVSLLLATLQHRRDQKTLRSIDPTLPAGSQAMVLAGLIALLGFLAFGLILFRMAG
jgi:putative membrane protein